MLFYYPKIAIYAAKGESSMSQTKEVEDMEKFMTVLMEVKVSLATQNEKLDTLLDMKPKIEQAYEYCQQC